MCKAVLLLEVLHIRQEDSVYPCIINLCLNDVEEDARLSSSEAAKRG
jgi:hypothetical protein